MHMACWCLMEVSSLILLLFDTRLTDTRLMVVTLAVWLQTFKFWVSSYSFSSWLCRLYSLRWSIPLIFVILLFIYSFWYIYIYIYIDHRSSSIDHSQSCLSHRLRVSVSPTDILFLFKFLITCLYSSILALLNYNRFVRSCIENLSQQTLLNQSISEGLCKNHPEYHQS